MKTTIIKTIPIAALAAVLLTLGACSNMLTELEKTDETDGIAIEGPVYDTPNVRHAYSSSDIDNSDGKIQATVATSTDFSSTKPLDEQELPAEGAEYELNMTASGSLATDDLIFTADFIANDDSAGMYSIKAIYDLTNDIPVDKPDTATNLLMVTDGGAGFLLFSYDSDGDLVSQAYWVYAGGEAVIGGPDYTQEIGSNFSYSTKSGAEVSVHVELEEGWNRLVHEYTWNDAGDAVESASVTTDSQRDLDWFFYSP